MPRNHKKRRQRKRLPWSWYESTAHLGSKRGFMRLPLVSGSDGKLHVVWPSKRGPAR